MGDTDIVCKDEKIHTYCITGIDPNWGARVFKVSVDKWAWVLLECWLSKMDTLN